MIVFEDSEVEFDCGDSTGKLIIRIPIKTVLDKLPSKKLKAEYIGYSSQEDIEHEYFPKLSGVDFQVWLSMNFEQSKSRKRSLSAYAKLLNDLLKLAEKYGLYQLNEAMSKCKMPEKCTIAYLQAILKNNNQKEIQNGSCGKKETKVVRDISNYRESIAEAVGRFM